MSGQSVARSEPGGEEKEGIPGLLKVCATVGEG